MSCQTLSALTHLLTEVNESVEEWKESSHKMEKNRDYWRKRATDLKKKLYRKQCLSRQKEVEDLNDGETMELCAEYTERLRSTTDMQERLKFLEAQIKHWQNSSAFESTRYLTLSYNIHCEDWKSVRNRYDQYCAQCVRSVNESKHEIEYWRKAYEALLEKYYQEPRDVVDG